MTSQLSDLVRELPKSNLPAGTEVDGGQYVFYVSGPTPLRCDRFCREGDALILSTGGNAAIHYAEGQFAYSTDCWALEAVEEDVDGRFLYYFLNSQIDRINALGFEGSGLKHLRKNFIRKYPVPEFDRPEQSKIVEVLSIVDRAIEQTEALIVKQQRIKTGLMQDLLTRGIDEHGNLRSEKTHEFKDSPLGRIPEEWEVTTLGVMLKRARGYLQTGPFGSQLHAHEYVHEGTPVIMPQDILNGRISTSVIAKIPERRANDLDRHRLLPNDIVFARRGDLSRAAGIGEREAGWICGTGCFLLRVPPDVVDSTWLANVYRHLYVQRQIETNAVGSTMPSLNNAVMENLIIAFPKADEQREIMRRCDSAAVGITSAFNQLTKMRTLKLGLMQDLLTGNRRVTAMLQQTEAVTA